MFCLSFTFLWLISELDGKSLIVLPALLCVTYDNCYCDTHLILGFISGFWSGMEGMREGGGGVDLFVSFLRGSFIENNTSLMALPLYIMNHTRICINALNTYIAWFIVGIEVFCHITPYCLKWFCLASICVVHLLLRAWFVLKESHFKLFKGFLCLFLLCTCSPLCNSWEANFLKVSEFHLF